MRFGAAAEPVANADPALEKQVLKNQADSLQNELDAIRKRLEEIDKKDGQE
jgi:prefoldin subunit 5